MSGVALMLSPCLACGRVISYNPHKVPSYRHPQTGKREPICESCMTVINKKREELGLEPHPILDGAYDPVPEDEL